jgi:hypothetical protein
MNTLNYFLNLLNFIKINNILITYTYYHILIIIVIARLPPVESLTLAEAKRRRSEVVYIDIFYFYIIGYICSNILAST